MNPLPPPAVNPAQALRPPAREIYHVATKRLPGGGVLVWIWLLITEVVNGHTYRTRTQVMTPALACPCSEEAGPSAVAICAQCDQPVCLRWHTLTCPRCLRDVCLVACATPVELENGGECLMCTKCVFQLTASWFRRLARWLWKIVRRK